MLSGETAVLAAKALADMDKYVNLTTCIARCGCGCDRTLVELYRSDPSGQTETYAVAGASGADVFEALILAHAQLLKAIQDNEQRAEEIASLEMLFHESE